MLGMIGVGALASWATNNHWSQMGPGELAHFQAVTRSLVGVNLAQLAIIVLGVLVITGEYATGMIIASLGAAPKRTTTLLAKLTVFGVITFCVSLVSSFIAFVIGQQLLQSHGVGLGAPHAIRAIFGVAIYLTLIGAMSLGVGFAIRSTAGGIATVLGIVLVLPALQDILPTSWQPHTTPYLPSNAGSALYSAVPDPGSLSLWTGFFVLLAWAVAALALGLYLLKRRDA
ncbi:ABC transporter permease [Leekyejoonella antrihumi]|uniref:ABC transporter permease n=2 Tax=Leekyejoonella antrihumi TaxID=1660198 RepID=A0A563E2Y9_9MICO|nr:ABC transporter permease [Leekyejoonella antrihumi]